jgi:hypothetical protein
LKMKIHEWWKIHLWMQMIKKKKKNLDDGV